MASEPPNLLDVESGVEEKLWEMIAWSQSP
jgi:hypothetical protein